MNRNEILSLVEKVHDLKKDKTNTLPENSYFLDSDEILCCKRSNGDSRYPYYFDGLTVFAHSDGYIDCVEGDFNVFKCAKYNEDSFVAFFAGEKKGDYFFPISVTGAAHQLFEEGIERYTVFTPVCAYYIVESEKAIYAMRTYVDENKHIRFALGAVNLGEERELYLCSYFEPTLRNDPMESFSKRMTKFGERLENGGYVLKTTNEGMNCLAVRTKVDGTVTEKYGTTAKISFVGDRGGNLTNAVALKDGFIEHQVAKTNTTDFPIACDMVHFALGKDDFVQISYEMAITHHEEKAKEFAAVVAYTDGEEARLSEKRKLEKTAFNRTVINFENWNSDKINPVVLNNFLGCVQRQVSFCALGKNYATSFLGIRDVFQQLELSLIWQKEESRAQIVRVMDFILEDGRPPRQITFPMFEGQIPKMDLRPFIDQGLWIISTLHTYLAYTDDYSILDEICGYYKAENTYGPLSLSSERDTILEHLLRIMKFLISNIDEDTHCLRALFGDWNDALDGLGNTKDKSKEYGNGVSVMATLQLYLSLELMCEILEKVGNRQETIAYYKTLREEIAAGIEKYALIKDKNGFARMAHGWGEDREYYVGSFKDHDGESRISLTANAFCAISGIIERFPEHKEDIVKNIMSLDTRFGLLTFDTPFRPENREVGRICDITEGTYENACTYVHAGTFGAAALFIMGHSKEAWDTLEKAMVISHDTVTMSTFVMPNSYCIDGKFSFNGESMGDWHTGSGAVLIKDIIKYGFGIEPAMDSVKITPAAYFPTDKAEITLSICGRKVTFRYENRAQGERGFYLNGQKLDVAFDHMRNTPYVVIDKKDLADNCTVIIVD